MKYQELQDLKVGDAVGIMPSYSTLSPWKKDGVVKVTETQITLGCGSRFLRRNGNIIGGKSHVWYKESLASVKEVDHHNKLINDTKNHDALVARMEMALSTFKHNRILDERFEPLLEAMEASISSWKDQNG